MFGFRTKFPLVARSRLKSPASIEAENLLPRQQVIVLSRKFPSQVRPRNIDRLLPGYFHFQLRISGRSWPCSSM
jgi:hypothetical protein